MKYVLTCFLLFTFSHSHGQRDITLGLTEITKNVTSFKYHCEGIVGEAGIEPKKLTIEKFSQEKTGLNFKFRVTTNCANTGKGAVIIAGDTIRISENLTKENFKRTEYIDSLGQEVVTETWDESSVFCHCLSRYDYKLRDVKADIKVICFQKECVRVRK